MRGGTGYRYPAGGVLDHRERGSTSHRSPMVAVRKSQAAIAWPWLRRNSGQAVCSRPGAGSVPCFWQDLPPGRGRHLDAEDGEFTVDTRVHRGFAGSPTPVSSRASPRTRAWTGRPVRGRPGRFGRDASGWRRRMRSRCQRRIVSGETINCNCRRPTLGSGCRRAAKERPVRAGGVCGLPIRGCRTASWWRGGRISMSSSASRIGSSPARANAPDRAR